MPIKILMPALSPTMEKGNLARWLKKEGDAIKSGDVIAEIETDKATMEVEAVDEGVLAKILVPDGAQDVKVNELIALIAGEGEDAKAVASGAGASAPAAAAPARRLKLRPPLHRLRLLPLLLRPPPSPQRPAAACSPRRSPGVSPRKPASTFPPSKALAPMAASSSAT